jgi:hypothetical protein
VGTTWSPEWSYMMIVRAFFFLGFHWWSKRPNDRSTNDLHISWFLICRHSPSFFFVCIHPCPCCTKNHRPHSFFRRDERLLAFVCAFLSCPVQSIDLPACYIHTCIHAFFFFFFFSLFVLTTFAAFFLLLFHILVFFHWSSTSLIYDFSLSFLVPCPLPIDH